MVIYGSIIRFIACPELYWPLAVENPIGPLFLCIFSLKVIILLICLVFTQPTKVQ